ncbi:DUF397 domain-containing protein [Parafrankia discariae]|uniref:DUF397 domain-containing protein n=1 Tax=Parafrankia discariae TaxID=365528 RepID=UPI001E3A9109|nr:DUF397 domain-containing protein [Parafrankia discariae]
MTAACPGADQLRQGRRPHQKGLLVCVPRSAPDFVSSWQQPSTPHPTAVDAVEVARGPTLVLIRSSLGRVPVGVTPGAWAAFVAAVRYGEYEAEPVADYRPVGMPGAARTAAARTHRERNLKDERRHHE